MKKLFAIAVLMSSVSAFATGTPPPVGVVTVTGSGNNQVNSSAASGSYAFGAGSSVSKASNIQTATSYVGGSGSFSQTPTNQFVSLADCLPDVKVAGTLTKGAVTSFGGTSVVGSSIASNVSTGSGTGGAAAGGMSFAEVAGKTTGVAPGVTLSAEGTAFSGVSTLAQAGKNERVVSNGATSSSFVANASGSLFTFNTGGVVGDVKNASSNTITRVGDLACPGGKCNGSTLVNAYSNNATIEAGATANAVADVKALIKLK